MRDTVMAKWFDNDFFARNDSEPKYKVGQIVYVKFDIEQPGKIESVIPDRYGPPKYMIRVHEGGYVNNRKKGELVRFSEEDIYPN